MDKHLIKKMQSYLNESGFTINLQQFRKNPTSKEASTILNFLINKILKRDFTCVLSEPEICNHVNGLLKMLNSAVMIYYCELLQPKQSTLMAIDTLSYHLCKCEADEFGINSKARQIEMQITQMEVIKNNIKQCEQDIMLEKNCELYADHQALHDLLMQDNRYCLEKQQTLKESTTHLKQMQDEVDMIAVQINEMEHKDDKLQTLYEHESSLCKQQMTYEAKKRQLEELEDELNQEEQNHFIGEISNATEYTVEDDEIVHLLKERMEQLLAITEEQSLCEKISKTSEEIKSKQNELHDKNYIKQEQKHCDDDMEEIELMKKEEINEKAVIERVKLISEDILQELHIIRDQIMFMENKFKDARAILKLQDFLKE